MATTKHLLSIEPVRASLVLGIVGTCCGAVQLPFYLLAAMVHGEPAPAITGLVNLVVYPFTGFVGGFLAAYVYNYVAQYIGGFEYMTSGDEASAGPSDTDSDSDSGSWQDAA